MVTAIIVACALVFALFYPLVAPWRKLSLYVWLIVWFGSWVLFFYLSQVESTHYNKGQNSAVMGLFIIFLAVGSLIRAFSRGIALRVRRRKEQQLRSLAGGP